MSTLVALPHMESTRRHKKMLRDGSGEVWPDHAEVLFSRAIQEFDRQSSIASANSPYPPDLPSRNEFIVRFLKDRGLERTKQQVASHIQQLKKRSSKELTNGGASNPSSPSVSGFGGGNGYGSNPSDGYYGQQAQTQQSSMYYAPPPTLPSSYSNGSFGSSTSNSSMHGHGHGGSPIQAIAIRVNDAQPLHVPTTTLLSAPPRGGYSSGPATLTGVTPSSTGTGTLSIRIRLLVPPHQPDALAHLASSRINAIVSLTSGYSVQTTTLGNKISLNGMFLLEETDNFLVDTGRILCPLRVSDQTRMMVGNQSPGLPVTIQQTVYGGSSPILKITYELVHSTPQPLSSASAMYQYPPSSGPFTQF